MDDERLAKQVGRLVRHLRIEAGLSQERFANLCELHRTYVGAIERGEKSITVDTADKLARAFNLTLSEFFYQLETHSDYEP